MPMTQTQHIKFQQTCLNGVEAMDAVSARSFPRHTHDQYGIGMIDRGAQASVSDSRQVEAGPGNLIFVNPGEVHDGHAIGDGPRAWRMLYFSPNLLQAAHEDVLDGSDVDLTFPAPVGVDEPLADLFNTLYARATQPKFDLGMMACESSALALVAHLGRRLVRTSRSASASRAALRKITDRIDADPAIAGAGVICQRGSPKSSCDKQLSFKTRMWWGSPVAIGSAMTGNFRTTAVGLYEEFDE